MELGVDDGVVVGDTTDESDGVARSGQIAMAGGPSEGEKDIKFSRKYRSCGVDTHRGDSGMNNMLIPRMAAQTRLMPTTVLHDAAPERLRVPNDIKSSEGVKQNKLRRRSARYLQATRIPNVIKSWYVAVFVPRIWGGAVSAWYIGTAAESPPTPRPAMRRPTETDNVNHMWSGKQI